MIVRSRRFLYCFLLCLFASLSFAAKTDKPAPGVLSIAQAEKRLDQLDKEIAKNTHSIESINQSVQIISTLIDRADDCIQDSEEKIGNINLQMKQYFGAENKASQTVDAVYLQKQLKKLNKQLARCRLLKIRAGESLNHYREQLLHLQQQITFTRDKTIFQRLMQVPGDLQGLTSPALAKTQGLFSGLYLIYILLFISFAFFINWHLHRLMHKRWQQRYFVLAKQTFLLSSGFIFLFISRFSVLPLEHAEASLLYQQAMTQLSYYMLSLYGLLTLFYLKHPRHFIRRYIISPSFLKAIALVIANLYFIQAIGSDILNLFQASENLLLIFDNLILFISLAAMLYFLQSFYRHHKRSFKRVKYPVLFYQLTIFATISLLILGFSGYTMLALNGANFIFSLLILTAVGGFLIPGVTKLYYYINHTPAIRWFLKKNFGYNSEPPYFELTIFKYIIQLSLFLGITYLFSQLIEEFNLFIAYFFEAIFNGFNIGAYQIVPMEWLSGLLVFCLLILLSRYIATQISRNQPREGEEEAQVALASISLYAGFFLAAIIALLTAGFSFTSLAIIAGALSVGIGLGLQSIVNNFFSGLILLIEKPIKAGDRIRIDEVEGFVKEVKIRSTQIQTPTQEDIIIPNSDLITHQVTNYMYSDKNWRVQVDVGVAYGSDTALVRDLLMEVALAHPEVLKGRNKKPVILFKQFGDSALVFALWCMIKDVNQKYVVSSDLHFAIDKAFREHDITIAFPQRDVHVTLAPEVLEKVPNRKT